MNDSTWQSAREKCEVFGLNTENMSSITTEETQYNKRGTMSNCRFKSHQTASAEHQSSLLGTLHCHLRVVLALTCRLSHQGLTVLPKPICMGYFENVFFGLFLFS